MAYLVYDQGNSLFFTYVKVLEVMLIGSTFPTAWNEAQLKSKLLYSKFTSGSEGKFRMVPSRIGMLITYMPAALVGFMFFASAVLPNNWNSEDASGLKVRVLAAAVFIHFLKRALEAGLLHRFSGEMGLTAAFTISTQYILMAVNWNLVQQASERLTAPAVDTTWVGVVVFLTGIIGNSYHHILLRGLRKEGSKGYKVPQGGLFDVFVAPHYLFEIVTFVGIFLIAQTVYAASTLFFVILYLISRSYGTKKWYLQKVDGFPENRCVLIPHLF